MLPHVSVTRLIPVSSPIFLLTVSQLIRYTDLMLNDPDKYATATPCDILDHAFVIDHQDDVAVIWVCVRCGFEDVDFLDVPALNDTLTDMGLGVEL